MKKLLCLLCLLTVFPAKLSAEAVFSDPATFGGGLNVKTISSEISDEESPDMSNMYNDLYGTSGKRNGSKRYLSQAFSTNPFTSVFKAYASTGSTVRTPIVATTWDRVLVSTDGNGSSWVTRRQHLGHNQLYSYAMANSRVILTGDGLVDPIWQYDVMRDSFSPLLAQDVSTTAVVIRAKHLLNSRNYLLAGNAVQIASPTSLAQGSTYYNSRVYYSLVLQPSSFTLSRFIDFQADDGEEVTFLGEQNGVVHVGKQSSIFEIDFTVLNLDVNGGDIKVRKVVEGFGCIAPKTFAMTPYGYIMLAKDGLRSWTVVDSNRQQQSKLLSVKAEPIIKRMIDAGTYQKACGVYYPKFQWYVLSFEDPAKLPRGKNNSILIFDMITGNIYPFNNWLAASLGVFSGIGDSGDLAYGDQDGYIHYANIETSPNDSRKELPIHSMDNQANWARGNQELTLIQEGTASIRMTTPGAANSIASTTYMAVIDAGTWPDGTEITRSDLLNFKVYVASQSNMENLRIDLEMNDVTGDFDTEFTSVTLTSNVFTNNGWTEVSVELSSFPLKSTWIDISSEALSFADALTYYGIRFVVNAASGCNVYLDDLRIAQATDNPLNAYRFTKQFNFGSQKEKTFHNVIVNVESGNDSNFYIDTFNNFGEFIDRKFISGGYGNELVVAGYNGRPGLFKLNSANYAVIDSTDFGQASVAQPKPVVADKKFVYTVDHYNDIMFKIDKSSFGVVVGSAVMTGKIYQMSIDDKADGYIYGCNFSSHSVEVRRKSDLALVLTYGTLGRAATSYHNPTGIATDDTYNYVAQDGNGTILKVTKSTGGFVLSKPINLNRIGNTTLAVNARNLFAAYERTPSAAVNNIEVVLEKRVKPNLDLVERVIVSPVGDVSVSSTITTGDITLSDEYVSIPFRKTVNGVNTHYIQRRLLDDISKIVDQHIVSGRHFAVSHNGASYVPSRKTYDENIGFTGRYLQLRYWENSMDNNMKLFNQAFKVTEGSR